jgi:hypothetical protein
MKYASSLGLPAALMNSIVLEVLYLDGIVYPLSFAYL